MSRAENDKHIFRSLRQTIRGNFGHNSTYGITEGEISRFMLPGEDRQGKHRRSRGDLHNEMMCLQSRVRQFENMLKKTPREG